MSAAWAQECRTEARLAVFGGPAFFTGVPSRPLSSRPFAMGMSADTSLIPLGRGGLGAGVLAEGGVYHPALSGTGNYYFSGDAMLTRVQPDWLGEAMKVRPFVVAGYTMFFNATGSAKSVSSASASSVSASAAGTSAASGGLSASNAANIGLGVDRQLHDDLWLRVEVREHYTPDGGQHVLAIRVGLVSVGPLQ
jgi:hypothetical protein